MLRTDRAKMKLFVVIILLHFLNLHNKHMEMQTVYTIYRSRVSVHGCCSVKRLLWGGVCVHMYIY